MNAPARITPAPVADCERIGRLAVRSLYREVALAPKPGLVSPVDNGSHDDMDMSIFFRSLFALRHYFRDIARAGADGAGFATLQSLGLAAEAQMLAATGGINTHRGAIFNLGLLCAAAGRVAALSGTADAAHVNLGPQRERAHRLGENCDALPGWMHQARHRRDRCARCTHRAGLHARVLRTVQVVHELELVWFAGLHVADGERQCRGRG